ncbi:MAG: glycoside hydrolase family 13 protein [Ruminococcaceae bacterium]|nr:glycoside hydrolase family 13 protein [Oscillospiraceae bacterium]
MPEYLLMVKEMQILYNSKNEYYKVPFGCLRQDELCTLHIKIPVSCQTESVRLCISSESGFNMTVPFSLESTDSDYEVYVTKFSLFACDLYFYYFNITTKNESFDLFKQGDDTNIAVGDLWQLTCFDKNYDTPYDFKGRVMYQIFPDRFAKSGEVDSKGKLMPYELHKDVNDTPIYLPNANGRITNSDFFGGNLAGITEKLPYIKDMGVGIIYLNPIFMAYSNHRYDTADYKKIDPLLGTEEDFEILCREAHKLDIKIILDGVFSHTGSNSIYFDAEGIFGNGAVSNPDSPYREWFQFDEYPHSYTSWWGIDTLPCVNELNQSYMNYIIHAEDSVICHWMKLGADGFRLDVADELPDEFIAAFHKKLKEVNPNAILLGEVWEDASNKISYSKRRKYFSNTELDSVMNYPFKEAIMEFVIGKITGRAFADRIMTIAENYPRPVLDCLMNLLSTHDTPRIITALSGKGEGMSKSEKANFRLSGAELDRALALTKVSALLQFTLPGNPSIYYGDEIGMEGFEDPLNRCFYKWENQNTCLQNFYKELAFLKNENEAIKCGDIVFQETGDNFIKFARKSQNEIAYIVVSIGDKLECNGKTLLEVSADNIYARIYA